MNQGVIRILGKGDRERLSPLGEEAMRALKEFVARPARGDPARAPDRLPVPDPSRRPHDASAFWHIIKRYARKASIARSSPAHPAACLCDPPLNHGADLRVVQMLLGHSDLSTTQIYTHVARERLKELHATHHPRG